MGRLNPPASALAISMGSYHIPCMIDKAKRPAPKALQRWEGEGGATEDGPQQVRRKKRSRDTKRIVDMAAGDAGDRKAVPEEEGKDPAAVCLGQSRIS